MTIKGVKITNLFLNELEFENYIIDSTNINKVTIETKNKADEINIQNLENFKKKINTNILPKKNKKSQYIIFIQKMTDEYKIKYPKFTPKERREKILNLWKIQKNNN